jgi:Pro-kumamolisin, activation domain/PQQ-like domain/Putative Ig domain
MASLAQAEALTPARSVLDNSIRKVETAPATGSLNPHKALVFRSALTAGETNAALEFEVALKMRNFSGLQARVTRGERISPEEMTAKYNPLDADYAKVVDWLTSQGFAITRQDKNHLAVFARGKLGQIQGAMQMSFARVAFEGNEYSSAVTAPTVPTDLSAVIVGINGLQPHLRMHRHAVLRPDSLTSANPPYLPSQIAKAYDASGLYSSNITGAGQTIAIVIDTFPSASDLTSFWATYHVNQSIGNISFIQAVPGTLPAPEGEETLDTEWSSSIAPGAKVRVYASQSLSFSNLDQTYQQVYSDVTAHPEYGIHQMSMSYGIGETYTTSSQVQTDDQYFAELASAGVTVFASSGDSGATPGLYGAGDESGPLQASSPASDPNVTGVGGTSLNVDSAGNESSEVVWNNSTGASGGGVSLYFSRPYWQTGPGVTTSSTRLVPDVASSADPFTGAVVVIGGSQVVYGGTSWSSPTWAGFCALINQNRANASLTPIGLLGPFLYPLAGTSCFRDIVAGNNATYRSNGLYNATVGYDLASGLGAPNVQTLAQTLLTYRPVQPLAPILTSSQPPASMTVGATYHFNFTASGYPTPTFSLTSGSLPPGLGLTPAGLLSGVATAGGIYTSTVTASNGVAPAASLTFSINVQYLPTAPAITNGPPPATALATTPYSFTYTSSGYPAATFSLNTGSLPPGVTLSAGGVLSGTPTQSGIYSGTVAASNGISPNATQNFTINVQQPVAPAITDGPPPSAVLLNAAYSFTYTGTGFPTPSFSISAGSLPPGITLSSSGSLSGKPTLTGTYTGTVVATNGFDPVATQNFTIAVQQPPTITSTPLSVPVAINASYTYTFATTSYPPPTFSLTAGALPPGMTLSPTGVLSGSATQTGTFTGTVTATNAAGSTSQAFTISVQANLIAGLSIPASMNEGDPDGTGTITLDATSSNSTTVQLTSSNAGALTVPASVVVPAGQTTATFPYTIVDNLNVYGTETTTVAAHIPGWVDGKQVVTITDNKTTDNWSSYGNGQAHTGVYPGPLLAGTYTQAWSASTQNTGNAAGINQVAISKGIVYVTPISYPAVSTMMALNAATGAPIWQYAFSSAFSINPPTVYKGNVYIQRSNNGGDTNLWSLNAATGNLNWTSPFGSQWEHYLAPTVYQSIGVWMDGGTYGGLYNFGFDGTQKSFTDEAQYDEWTPTYYNGTIYSWVGGTFSAVNPATGALLWSLTEPYYWHGWSMNCAAPIVNNLAYLNGDLFLTAVNVTTQATAWKVSGTFTGTPAVNNGMLYVISGSQVEILNASTGVTVSTVETNDTGLTGQPVLGTDSLIVSSSTNTYLFNLQTGALVQAIPYGGPVSVAGGNLYIAGSDGALHVFHPSTANLNLTSNGGGALTSYGYNATGQMLNVTLNSIPTTGTVLTVINNTGPSPITGTFTNLSNGGTINLTYNGTTYIFTGNYSGGDGNDLTLTYTSAPPQAPIITSAPPPSNAIAPFAYTFTYNASGYPAPTYNVTSGSLPPGLSLSSAGTISGTPTQPGSYTGTVIASNGVSPTSSQAFSIIVQQATAPTITSNAPPADVNFGADYDFTFTTSGFPAPTFTVTSGNLPPGLSLSAGGVLFGTPTQVGNYTVTITASNGFGSSASQSLTIVVQQGPVITSEPIAAPLLLNANYNFTVTATGNPAPTFSVSSGSLPPGITLATNGTLSGAPTETGLFTGTITALNSTSSTSQSFTLSVQAGPALMVVLPGTVNESDPNGQGAVLMNTTSSSAVTVQLTSSDTGALTVPASVVIPAGQTSVALPYTIIDNLAVYGSQTSTVTAAASGWSSGTQAITVTDNKTTDNWASYGNGQAHTGVYQGTLLGSTYDLAWSSTLPSAPLPLNPVAISQGVVYITPISRFGISDLTALNASSGAQLWQYVYSATGNINRNNTYNSINPPTVYKGNVYVQQGQGLGPDTGGNEISVAPALWSFDAASGQVNWTVGYGAQWESYLAPTVYQTAGICVDGGEYGGLYDFNFDGSQRSFTFEQQYDEWTPTFYNGIIYTWVGGTFTAFDPATDAVLWSGSAPYSWDGWSMNCAAPIANNLAFLNGVQSLSAMNLTTHMTAWTLNGTFTGTPAVNNGTLYVISGSQVEALNANTGALVSTFQTADTGLAGQPVVAADSLVISSSTSTYLFNLQTGSLVQTIPYGGPVSVALGSLYIAGSDGVLRVYHPSAASINLASDSSGKITSFGYSAAGQTLNATLNFIPTAGESLTVINNTSPNPINGTFSNLPNGGTIDLTYNGATFTFTANYSGGDGDDLTLTYTPPGGGVPAFTNGLQAATIGLNTPFSFAYAASGYPAPTFSIISGNLPPGLILSSTGILSGTATQKGSYTGTIRADNGVGVSATQNFTITVAATLAEWESLYLTAQKMSDQTVSGAAATPLHDGIPNLLKYLFDINPVNPMSAADRAALPVGGIDTTTTPGTQYLTLTFRENESTNGISVHVQTSTDLQAWQTITPNFTRNMGIDSATGDPIVEVEVKTTSNKQQFIRLNVTTP